MRTVRQGSERPHATDQQHSALASSPAISATMPAPKFPAEPPQSSLVTWVAAGWRPAMRARRCRRGAPCHAAPLQSGTHTQRTPA